jgi:DNA-binding MarR family transcriptional regulator
MRASDIERVRRFNRAVAEGIGALEQDYLGRGRPLGEARVLWEIGSDGADVQELRERLGFDSGYLSRLLRSLERQRLVKVRVDPDDRRRRRTVLTDRGQQERRIIDARSDALAQRIIEPLTEKQRATFLTAVADIERLLQPSMVRFAIERPTSADAKWCWQQYFSELAKRFEGGFDPRRALPVDTHEVTPPGGALILARLHGRPIGSGSVKTPRGRPAYLKRMWVSPSARGLGIGRRLLAALEDHARDAGASLIQLETNRALTEAIALYRASGYVEVPPFNTEPYADHWFEKPLVRRAARRG